MTNTKIYINGRFLTQKLTGVQRFAYEIADRLRSTFEVEILMPNAPILDNYKIERWNITKLGKLTGQLWEQVELPKALGQIGNPLLLNLCNSAPYFYSNNVVTIHDLAFLENKWHSFSFRLWYKILIPKIVNKAKCIFTVSEFSKSLLLSVYGLSSEKVTVVFNGIDHLKGSAASAKEKIFLSVGSMDPRKNIHATIQAFLSSKAAAKGYRLVIVGGLSSSFNFDESLLKANKENVQFRGYVTDQELIDLYEVADFFLFPSLYEGFGIPVLEAMNFGCCVITSQITSLPEVCGDAAYYVDPYQVSSISKAIDTVLDDTSLKQNLLKNGNERVKKYAWQTSERIVSQVLQKIVNLQTK